jgi:adenine-specific DNA glycosylase
MPGCPMHEGMPPTSCMDSTVSCCAMEERESITRRTLKPEKKNTEEQTAAQVVVANASPSLLSRARPERQMRAGIRYEKPVLELKTDLRI